MAEEYLFRRRNRLKKHFVATSNVLLYGYHHLSDGAKITYQVVDSFDWEDESKTSKGYVFPSMRTIARIRGVSERTIQRHIKELVAAELLTRQERPGETTILIIEDASNGECQAYLRQYVERGDKNVAPDKNVTPAPTKMSPKIEQRKEQEIIVNENVETVADKGRWHKFSDIVRFSAPPSDPEEQLHAGGRARREYYAQEMLKALGDNHSLGCYRTIADDCPPEIIFEALALVKETARNGNIKKSKGALFVDILKRIAKGRGHTVNLRVSSPPILGPSSVSGGHS